MNKRTSSLPLLVIVAVVALVLGSFGSATAAGLTKGTVKKIATKVVNKKAPTLTVAHASSADTAGNATNLNGLAASAYQDNATFIATSAATPIAVTNDTAVLTGNITVPAGRSLVRATGNLSMAGTNGDFVIYLTADAACAGVAPPHAVYSAVSASQVSATVDFVFAATPGAHTYRFCASASAGQSAYTRTLTLMTLAGGSRTTSPRPASEGTGSLSLR